jgi:hypothetical protein
MSRRLLPALALAACTSAPPTGKPAEAGYAGPSGWLLQFAPPDDPSAGLWQLRAGASAWELRDGPRWATAPVLVEAAVEREPGLVWDGVVLLPPDAAPGAQAGGTEVIGDGPLDVYYGRFPDVLEVSVGEGRFAGPWAFAFGVGPVRLTVDGATRELVYYEPSAPDAADSGAAGAD